MQLAQVVDGGDEEPFAAARGDAEAGHRGDLLAGLPEARACVRDGCAADDPGFAEALRDLW
ncbi:MAG TPA: hypothetical protein VNB91_04340 [Jatrophihabitantaceae bacterium]|nr:hypothetical protein [Jatrophihabitantaceae bacterium]